MFEDDLIPLFDTIGVIMQFRLMMKYSGNNRGFGYIIYVCPNDGYRAIQYLNDVLLNSWCRLKLIVSSNIRHICLTNVSDNFEVDDVIKLILEKVDPEEVRCFVYLFLF